MYCVVCIMAVIISNVMALPNTQSPHMCTAEFRQCVLRFVLTKNTTPSLCASWYELADLLRFYGGVVAIEELVGHDEWYGDGQVSLLTSCALDANERDVIWLLANGADPTRRGSDMGDRNTVDLLLDGDMHGRTRVKCSFIAIAYLIHTILVGTIKTYKCIR